MPKVEAEGSTTSLRNFRRSDGEDTYHDDYKHVVKTKELTH